MHTALRNLLCTCTFLLAASPVCAQWVPLGGPCSTRFTALYVNGATTLGGTYDGTIYRSTDSGGNWTPANAGIPSTTAPVYAFCALGNSLFAAAAYEAYRSTDNGASWTPANNGLPSSGTVDALMAAGGLLYAGLIKDGVYVSADLGASWLPINNGLDWKDVHALGQSGANFLAGTSNGRIYVSSDGGENWALKTVLISGNTLPTIQAFVAIDSVVLAGTSLGMFRSTDRGLTWNASPMGTAPANIRTLLLAGTKIYAGATEDGAEGSLYISTDKGATWAAGPLTDTGIFALAGDGSRLFAGTWAGTLLSTDSGAHWAHVNAGLPTASVMAVCSAGGNLLAGDIRDLFVSSDDGSSWFRPDLWEGRSALSFAGNGSTVWVGTDAGPRRSEDGGVHWTPASTRFWAYWGAPSFVYAMIANGSTLLAGSYAHSVLRSADGYAWTVVDTLPATILCFASDGTSFYAGTDGNGVMCSTDSGATWTQAGLPGQRIQALAVSGGNVFAGAYPAGVYRLTKSGDAWMAAFAGLAQTDVRALVFSGEVLFAATYGSGIRRTTNNGASWDPVIRGLPTRYVYSLALNGSTLLAGTEGYGVCTANLSELVSAVTQGQTSPSDFLLEQNYPNPFNPTTTIRYSLPQRMRVSLTIFNTLGQRIAEPVNGDVAAGHHEVQFNAGHLPSGIYFYRLKAGGFLKTRSFVLTR